MMVHQTWVAQELVFPASCVMKHQGPSAFIAMGINWICQHKNPKSFRNCLGTVQELYNFVEASPKRHALFQETQKQRSEKPLVLKSQSKTRWACHKAASSTLKSRLPAILQTLLNVDGSDSKLTSKCNAIAMSLQWSYQQYFVFRIHLLSHRRRWSPWRDWWAIPIFAIRKYGCSPGDRAGEPEVKQRN